LLGGELLGKVMLRQTVQHATFHYHKRPILIHCIVIECSYLNRVLKMRDDLVWCHTMLQ
jgi:hypothetical protein